MNRLGIVLVLVVIYSCERDPVIQFPTVPDPDHLTHTNYLPKGNILYARLKHSSMDLNDTAALPYTIPDPSFLTKTPLSIYGDFLTTINTLNAFLPSGRPLRSIQNLTGLVLQDYDPLNMKGVYIQDAQAGLFMEMPDNISLKRGDLIRLTTESFQRRTCSRCTASGGQGKLQAKVSAAQVLSSGGSLYCRDAQPPFPTGYSDGAVCVKVRGTVSHKSSSSSASWGMDNNTWAILIVNKNERFFPHVQVGDEIIAYGVFDAYPYLLAGGEVQSPYPLHVFDAQESIINTRNQDTKTLIGLATNSYNTSEDGNYFDGFFIQDRSASIFIKVTDKDNPVQVSQGDMVRIQAKEYKTSTHGQVYINNPSPSDITTLSTGNKVVYKTFEEHSSTPAPQKAPYFIKLQTQVTSKAQNDSPIWGLSNSILLRLVRKNERLFPEVYPTDTIIAFGVLDIYDGTLSAGLSASHSRRTLWVYGAHQSIIDLSIQH